MEVVLQDATDEILALGHSAFSGAIFSGGNEGVIRCLGSKWRGRWDGRDGERIAPKKYTDVLEKCLKGQIGEKVLIIPACTSDVDVEFSCEIVLYIRKPSMDESGFIGYRKCLAGAMNAYHG